MVKSLGALNDYKIIAIDPSTRSLAYAIMDTDNSIIDVGKIDLSSASDIHEKLNIIGKSLPILVEKYKPRIAVIEEAVFIQNFKTSKLISYVIGHTMGILSSSCKFVIEANPIVWKSAIGYKKVSKAEKAQWESEWGVTEGKKIAAKERKERVRVIIKETFGKEFEDSLYDSDEIDALAIGVWYNRTAGERWH